MSLIEIFKDSFNYAISDIKKLLILGVILLVASLNRLFVGNWIIYNILGIVAVILGVIVLGYTIKIIRDALEGINKVPDFDFGENLNDGVKALVVVIVYGIIVAAISIALAIIVTGIGYLGGSFNNIINLVNTTSTAPAAIFTDPSILMAVGIICILVFIVVFIFGLLANISICRLAKTGSVGEALSFGKVAKDIKAIGFGRYLGWYILLCIFAIIVAIVMALIGLIPYIGVLIGALIFGSFMTLFGSRAMGLLYSEID